MNPGELGHTFTQAMFVLPHSREHEQEADRIGVELAARAGYDPRAAVALWQKMAARDGGQPPQWLSTHPAHETRIRDLRTMRSACCPCTRWRSNSGWRRPRTHNAPPSDEVVTRGASTGRAT